MDVVAGGEIEDPSRVIDMDTFYTDSATLVEVPLAALLLPGRYTIRLTLNDSVQGVTATEPAIVLIIDAPEGRPRAKVSCPVSPR